MSPDQKRFYVLLSAAWLAGIGWLFYVLNFSGSIVSSNGVCFLKGITGIPCPSCGSTRSMVLLLQGDLLEAIWMNPLGIIAAILMAAMPVWIARDLLTHRPGLWFTYKQSERVITRRTVAIPAGALMALNWIWNIHKGL